MATEKESICAAQLSVELVCGSHRKIVNRSWAPSQGPNGQDNLFYNRLMRLFFRWHHLEPRVGVALMYTHIYISWIIIIAMAIPSLGDVATSALTRPTRRMCNQSTGHRGGQHRSGSPSHRSWPAIANGCHTVSGALVATCRLQVADGACCPCISCPFDRHRTTGWWGFALPHWRA